MYQNLEGWMKEETWKHAVQSWKYHELIPGAELLPFFFYDSVMGGL